MPIIELQFPVLGNEIPADHGYALYGAMSRQVEKLHTPDFFVRIGPILGSFVGNGRLRLDERRSQLRMRLRPEDLPTLLPLAGKKLDLAGCAVRLGVPQVAALVPATTLFSRLVAVKVHRKTTPATEEETTKGYPEPSEFLAAIEREMKQREISARVVIPERQHGHRAGKPCRHVLRVKNKGKGKKLPAIVGFSVIVQGLAAEESLLLQEQGLGGRGKMGCGFFVPLRG